MYQSVGDDFFICQCQEWADKFNITIYDGIYVITDIFCIRRYDWAIIMVISTFKFCTLIRNTRIEDEVNAFVYQPFNMSVGKFGRITFGFAWNGVDT